MPPARRVPSRPEPSEPWIVPLFGRLDPEPSETPDADYPADPGPDEAPGSPEDFAGWDTMIMALMA
jgi:hypothetical protein